MLNGLALRNGFEGAPKVRKIRFKCSKPTPFPTFSVFSAARQERAVVDPTTLILVDEADRLHMNSLEQIRSIFDEGTAGLVLIGMPGIDTIR
jgi:hypothetical protein